MSQETRKIPMLTTRAAVQPKSWNEEQRTVELVWSTGAQVRRYDWLDGPYIEELGMDPKNVRLSRLNGGAPLLSNHSTHSLSSVIGVVERAWVANGEGRAVVRFSDRDDVQPVIADVKSGILRNISVGYNVLEYEVDKPAERGGMPTYRATDWEPMEISIVTIPADASAQIRSASQELHSVTIKHRRTAMADPNTEELPAEGQAVPPAPQQPADAEAIRAAIRQQELDRISAIRAAAQKAKLDDAFAEKLINTGASVEDARSQILEAWSARIEGTVTGSSFQVGETHDEKQRRAMENAILARTGIVKYAEQQGNEFLAMRMSDFARACLENAGVNTRGMSQSAMAKMALSRSQTTSDFPVLLENTMHKMVLAAYTTSPDIWRQIAKVGSVSDFRPWKRLRTGSIANLSDVTEHGELTNMAIPDATAEIVQASRKGNIISITPETIINDDFGWIADQTAALGRAAARTIETAVIAKLVANPTMNSDSTALFHANHGNLSGTSDAISVASLDAARVAMRSQKDIAGNDYLDIRPKILLCPISKGGTARVTVKSQYDPDTANKLQRENIAYGIVEQIIDTPRLSGNAWYLLADPNEAPVIEIVFLDGNENPRLEQEADFRTKGLSWSVELPFGVAAIEYRGAYKNNGA